MVPHAGMNSSTASLSPHKLRALSVESQTDPRTVAKVLRGEPVRALPRDRVVAVLQKHGISVPVAQETAGAA